MGYVEVTYALQNDIKFGAVKNKEGAFIKGDLTSVTAAASGALAEIPDDLRFHGVLGPAAAWRSAVIPTRPEAEVEGSPAAGPGARRSAGRGCETGSR